VPHANAGKQDLGIEVIAVKHLQEVLSYL